jgi:hypothetical protein
MKNAGKYGYDHQKKTNRKRAQEAVHMGEDRKQPVASRLAELLRELDGCRRLFAVLPGKRPLYPGQPLPSSFTIRRCMSEHHHCGAGAQKGLSGDRVHTYAPDHYLVLSVPLPMECETEATPEEPLLAVAVQVDPADEVGALRWNWTTMMKSGNQARGFFHGHHRRPEKRRDPPAGMPPLPADSRILGPQMVTGKSFTGSCAAPEQHPAGHAASANSHFSQSARRCAGFIWNSGRFDVEALRRSQHERFQPFPHFKYVTTTSPLQYLKSIRLHKARMMMLQDGLNANMAAETGRLRQPIPVQPRV